MYINALNFTPLGSYETEKLVVRRFLLKEYPSMAQFQLLIVKRARRPVRKMWTQVKIQPQEAVIRFHISLIEHKSKDRHEGRKLGRKSLTW